MNGSLKDKIVEALEKHDIENYLLTEHGEDIEEEALEVARFKGYHVNDEVDAVFTLVIDIDAMDIQEIADMLEERNIEDMESHLNSPEFLEECYSRGYLPYDIVVHGVEVNESAIIREVNEEGIDELMVEEVIRDYRFELDDGFTDKLETALIQEGFSEDQIDEITSYPEDYDISVDNIRLCSEASIIADDILMDIGADAEDMDSIIEYIGSTAYYRDLIANEHIDYDVIVGVDPHELDDLESEEY